MWWKKAKQREFIDDQEKKKEHRFRINYSWIVKHIPFLVFLFFLALLYIANGHYMVKNVREVNQLQEKVKELHWTFLSRKSELMFRSKMSRVSEKAQPYGLEEAETPPLIIVKDKKEK